VSTGSRPPHRAAACALFAAVLLGALGLAACSSTSPGSTPGSSGPAGGHHSTRTTHAAPGIPWTTAPGTQEVSYDPYTRQGAANPSLHVVQTVTGTCVGSGVAGARSYRCFGQPSGAIYDPCFAPPRATDGPLLCVPTPSTDDVVAFDIGPLPAPAAGEPATRLWAMQLANGQVCVLVDAAWSGLGPFACPSPAPSHSVADCHAPVQVPGGWSASCQAAESPSSPFTTERLVTMWT